MAMHGHRSMYVHGHTAPRDGSDPVIAFAAIAPHGDVELTPELRDAMGELGRRFARATVDVAVVVTPHNVHVDGHFAVVTAGRVGHVETDLDLAAALLAALRDEGLPAVGVSYGGNDPTRAEMPLDWGTEVPLGFMRAERVVVVSPARDRPLTEHVRAGAAISRATGPAHDLLEDRRVALVASADHGHAHDADGPYGFDPAAAAYDQRLVEILAAGRVDFRPLAELAHAAKADSLWQLLVLQGAVGEDARVELLAYAAPTYYGMLCAEVAPAPRSA
jgi:aromatic ring-opening dioxygenase LigB subunit